MLPWFPAALAQAPPPIVAGHADAAHPAVGALTVTTGDWTDTFCSGTLVAANRVLTAAHCADQVLTYFQLGLDVGFVLGTRPLEEPAETTWVTTASLHPDWVSGGAYDDLAVLWLDRDAATAPMPVNGVAPAPNWLGRPQTWVGFGETGDGAGDQGERRSVDLPLLDYDDRLLLAWDEAGGNICNGDSGGAVVDAPAGVPVLVGVAAFGWNALDEGDAAACVAPGAAAGGARLDAYLDWLREEVDGLEVVEAPEETELSGLGCAAVPRPPALPLLPLLLALGRRRR